MDDLELALYGNYNSDAGKMRLQAPFFLKIFLGMTCDYPVFGTSAVSNGAFPVTEGLTPTNGVCAPVVFTQRIVFTLHESLQSSLSNVTCCFVLSVLIFFVEEFLMFCKQNAQNVA